MRGARRGVRRSEARRGETRRGEAKIFVAWCGEAGRKDARQREVSRGDGRGDAMFEARR